MVDKVAATVVTESSGPISVVRFSNPERRNPLSTDTLLELKSIVTKVLASDEVEAVIFTGTEDVFAAGADIGELAQLNANSAESFAKFGQDLFESIHRAKQITIAAINGYCMGGALDLALACDIRVASASAVFAHPGVKLGIITGWGGTQRLPWIIGRTRALELFLTGRRYSSDAALKIGLITRVCDPVMECARRCAEAAINVASSGSEQSPADNLRSGER
jgi:enoyl-CoA hydratase